MSSKNKIYFASDFHLGGDSHIETSLEREKKIIRWLNSIHATCAELYLVGDVFDYWFEYKNVIPKGYTRFFAKLIDFVENGSAVYIFSGNHDMWMFDYLEKEIGVKVIHHPIDLDLQGHKFHVAHGDGLGPGDYGYKIIKKIFRSSINQWLFARIHPNLGVGLMRRISQFQDKLKKKYDIQFNPNAEWLVQYAESYLEKQQVDFFVFGHRHLPIDFTLSNGKSRYINLGDMINYNTYAVFENGKLTLKAFENETLKIHSI